MIPFSYNLRSLTVRKATTVATVLGVALVAFVFSSLQMLANGIESTMRRSADPAVALVMRDGAETESQSSIDAAAVRTVLSAREVAQAANGQAMHVGESVGLVGVEEPATRRLSIFNVRGVPEGAFAFHGATIVEGRMPSPGTKEAVIGKALVGRSPQLVTGGAFDVRPGQRFQVVGVFAAQGSAFESEVWLDAEVLATTLRRPDVGVLRVKLQSPASFDAFRAAIEGNRPLGLQVIRESAYYERLGSGITKLVSALARISGGFFYLAAAIGAMITMFASVSRRTREIATMRALGFQKRDVLKSFLLEALILTSMGGAIGAVASLPMNLVEISTINQETWSFVVFGFEPTALILVSSAAAAAAVGLVGGIVPAVQASRLSPAQAMRKA